MAISSPSKIVPLIPHGTRILRGALSGLVLNILGYGFLFVGQLLIIRLLSQSEYAEFTVSVSFVAILATIADLGMNPLFSRLFAEAEEEAASGARDRRGILLGSALLLRILLSVLVAGVLLVIAPLIYPEQMVHTMSILLLTLLISSRLLIVRFVGDAVLRGQGKYYISAWFALFDAIAFFSLMILATYRQMHLEDVVWIYTLSNLPGFLLLTFWIVKWARREDLEIRATLEMMRNLMHASVPLALGTAFLTIHTQIDNLLLDKLSTPLEVSSYGATMRLSAAMSPFSLVLAAVTAPELTKFLQRGDHARAEQLTSISLRVLIVIGSLIAIIVTALSGDIVPLFLGTKYASANSLLIWTGWMLIPIFIGTLLMDVSIAAGYSWFMTVNAGICMVAVIIGDLLLIPSFGARGAMTSKLLAVTLGAGTIIWLSRNTGHLNAHSFTSAFLRTALASVVSLGIFWVLNTWSGLEFVSAAAMVLCFGLIIHYTYVFPLAEGVDLVKRVLNTSERR